ncbi:MAG: S41 family peptidase, partial [Planctomycetota bacterium]
MYKTISLLLLAVTAVLSVMTFPTIIAQDETPDVTSAILLRYPDVSASHICFVYGGDIWTVPKVGGSASRLSSAKGEEYKPRFSPDGKTVGFSANYDGNTDIYTLPIEGGIAKRITHHPARDSMIDWSPDGDDVLYSTSATSPTGRYNELYVVDADGGLPRRLPVPWGDNASFSPDGRSVAYTPWSRDFRTWKRYRGGMASRLWTFNLDTLAATEISSGHANFGNPMWSGDKVYYLCDHCKDCRSNIFVFDTKTGEKSQVTNFTSFDVRFPSMGNGEIVFELGGDLQLLDLKTSKTRKVEISVVTDGASLRPRNVNVSDSIVSATVSPNGKRAAFEARGDLFTVPAENGVTRNLTASSGVAERYPSWSPDGKTLGYFTDRNGEYELATQPAEGGDETIHTKLGPDYKYVPQWSPDSRKVVFIDQTMRIRMYDFDTKKTTEVDKAKWMYHGSLTRFRVSWSADSRWFTYSRGLK